MRKVNDILPGCIISVSQCNLVCLAVWPKYARVYLPVPWPCSGLNHGCPCSCCCCWFCMIPQLCVCSSPSVTDAESAVCRTKNSHGIPRSLILTQERTPFLPSMVEHTCNSRLEKKDQEFKVILGIY